MTVANIILVLGQSNALSFSTSGVAYPGGWTIAPLGPGYADVMWNPFTSAWAPYDPAAYPQWGPEAPIAMAKRAVTPQVCTYIVKYAVPGVGLAINGSAADWSPYSPGKTFVDFCARLTAGCAVLTSIGITPVISECYWVGNESDCFDWSKASSVAHDLPVLANTIRANFGSPNMKFIALRTKLTLGSSPIPGASPSPGLLPYVDIVRSAQEATGCLPRSAWANCDDLASGIISPGHYEPASIVTIGQRMFSAAEAIP